MKTLIFFIILNTYNFINPIEYKNTLDNKILEEINNQIDSMSMEEKVGQLFNIAIVGKKLSSDYKKLIKKYSISGITLFNYNMNSKSQVKKFIKELQANSKIPLFISVDQEGGRITRYKYGNFHPPSPFLLGKIDDIETSKKVAQYICDDLLEVGINLNLSPLGDILSNNKNHAIYDRAFSNDVKIVSKHVRAYLDTFHSNNIIATLKHFPGQGDFSKDTHKTLPISRVDFKTMNNRELIPFKMSIKNKLYAIMTSHSIFSSLDYKYPATLSKKILNDLLRDKLNYKYLVFSDGLEMQAVLKTFGLKKAVIFSLNAGVDVLTLNWNYENVKRAINYVLEAIKNKKINMKIIDEKLRRILYVKKLFLYKKNPIVKCDDRCIKGKNKFLKKLYLKSMEYVNLKKDELKNKKIYTNIYNLKHDKIKYIKKIASNIKNSVIITNKYNRVPRKIRKNNIIILLAPNIGLNLKNKLLIFHENNKLTRNIIKNILNSF